MNDTLDSKVDAWESLVALAHQIVHGGPTESVATDGGEVRSFARLQKESEEFYGSAESNANRAEAARDSINTTGKVFTATEGTAAGIAATTSGEQFAVLAADLLSWGIWRNNAGTAQAVGLGGYTKAWFDSIFVNGFSVTRTGYLYAWVDADGALLLGIKLDGTLWSCGQNVTAAVGNVALALAASVEAATAALTIRPGPTRSSYLIPFTDSADRIVGGFLKNGELEIKGVNLSTAVASLSGLLPLVSTLTNIYAWGDSLMENGTVPTGWVTLLSAATGRVVSARGLGGQNAQKIIGRQGSYLVTATVSGNLIPDTGPVNVTVSNGILDSSGTVSTIGCSVNGVAGTLSKSGAQYVFTRSAAGASTVVWPGTTLEIAVPAEAKYCTNVIWLGRNHFNYAQTVAQYDAQIATVLDAIDKAVKSLNPVNPKFMLVGVTNGSTEAVGSDGYNAILSFNAQLQARYPRQFLDIRKVLLESGTGAGQDATNYANGVIPASMRSDTQHFNAAGNAVIASAFQAKLSYLGI